MVHSDKAFFGCIAAPFEKNSPLQRHRERDRLSAVQFFVRHCSSKFSQSALVTLTAICFPDFLHTSRS